MPPTVHFLGFDLVDGADSYLIDYGDAPPPLGIPLALFNEAGLLQRREDADDLAQALIREWGLGEDAAPQVWALYRVPMPG